MWTRNLAMALRTSVDVGLVPGPSVFALGKHGEIRARSTGNTCLFLVLSGLATPFRDLLLPRPANWDRASRVAPIDKLSVPLVIIFAWLLLGEKAHRPALVAAAHHRRAVVIALDKTGIWEP